eukprot:TRINITY_DN11374_c0_g1_i1.p1 TRINITY_DN11374_c0_g1~~TRINITY_DN11374_c0_g1_i1.p1  ORF type:complete len:378 (-),score=74.13 TRINITY_DN11374_c0_g1_i1:17-1150(-)
MSLALWLPPCKQGACLPRRRQCQRQHLSRAGFQVMKSRSRAKFSIVRRSVDPQADTMTLAAQAAGLTVATAAAAAAAAFLQPWKSNAEDEVVTSSMQLSRLSIRSLPGLPRFGALLQGLELSSPILPSTALKLRRLLHEKGVLLFRGQEGLGRTDVLQLADVFGQPVRAEGQDEAVGTYDMKYSEDDRERQPSSADFWHSDNSYIDVPAGPTLLYALQVPRDASGCAFGDTLFSDTVLAARELPGPIRSQVQELNAAHNRLHNDGVQRKSWNEWEVLPDAVHPVLRKHPLTGEEALFVGPAYVSHLIGLKAEESSDLLGKIYAHMLQPAFTYRHEWQEGDLLVWDNARTLHKATTLDMPAGLERRMWRVQTLGPGWQ